MKNFGEIQQNTALFPIMFTSHNAAGAPIAPSAPFGAADIFIYKGVSGVQRATIAGVGVTSPFDAVVGLHSLNIDLSENSDIGFYAVGQRYRVMLIPATTTVDGQAVLAELATFEIVSHKTKQSDYFDAFVKATLVALNTSATQAELPAATYGDLQGSLLTVIGGAGVDQSTTIAGFDDTTDIAVFVETLSTALDGTSIVLIQKDGRNIIDAANPLDANIVSVNSVTAAAVQMAIAAQEMISGTAITGTLSVTQMSTNLTEATNDHYKDAFIIWTGGVLKGQRKEITAYNGTTKVLTFKTATDIPANTDPFLIV